MRSKLMCLPVAIMLLVTISAFAATDLKVSGQVRFRAEMDKRSFDTLAATITPSYGRVRVGVEAVIDSNVRAFVQIQDSRVFGRWDREGEPTSGTTANARNVDLHQGYLELPHLIGQHIGLKLGRFEVAWNNERLMGASDWDNVGRAWEGGAGWYHGDKFDFDLYVLDRWRNFGIQWESSLFVVGGLATVKPYHTSLFVIDDWDLYQYNHRFRSDSRFTAGLYTRQALRQFDFELTGAYQWLDRGYYRINAYMFQGELGFTFPAVRPFRIAGGIDYSSGDNDPYDGKSRAFDNLYYTGHKFRGYMDYFADTYSFYFYGLVDSYGRTRFEPIRGWTAGVDLHYFRVSSQRTCAGCSPVVLALKDIGWELDLVANTTRVRGAVLDAGFSVFAATDNFSQLEATYRGQRNHDLGYWGYFMATVNF